VFVETISFEAYFFYYIKVETNTFYHKLEYISGKTLNSVTKQFVKTDANISTKMPNELKKHRATRHGIGNAPANRTEKCPFCTMSLKSKWGLQKHSEIKHDTEIKVEVESNVDMGTEVQTMEFIIAS
jgi:hypothetical protein